MNSKREFKLPNPPSNVEYGSMRFLIFDAPNDDNLDAYIDAFYKYRVNTIIRVCESTYSLEALENRGFTVYDMPFPDGDAPPKSIVDTWLAICKKVFTHPSSEQNPSIGIHCIAGLGRAPILVSIALIEAGIDPVDAVNLIRSKRKGAINRMQLQYLKKYKKSGGAGCIIL